MVLDASLKRRTPLGEVTSNRSLWERGREGDGGNLVV